MGCSTCSKCKRIRNSAFCGTKKLTEKQLNNKNGFCSGYEQKKVNDIEKLLRKKEPFMFEYGNNTGK